MGFSQDFRWICKEMMILIYIASLEHISCEIFKKWARKKIMEFHQPPSTILFDDPHNQTTPPNFTPYTLKDA